MEQLDDKGRLVEQVSLIGLRLRMLEVRKPSAMDISFLKRVLAAFPVIESIFRAEGLFREESIALDRTIINLGRLRGIAAIVVDHASNRETADNEVFKPSNVKSDRVVDLIDTVLAEIEDLQSLSPSERKRI